MVGTKPAFGLTSRAHKRLEVDDNFKLIEIFQSSSFTREPSPSPIRVLINQDRMSLKMITGLIAPQGYHNLNKHLKNMGLADANLCQFCQEENESDVYVL